MSASAGAHIHGQVIVGAICAAGGAYLSTRFLLRYFLTHTLTPFAVYSVAMGVFCLAAFA